MTHAVLQHKLEGHTSDINCCAWSPTDKSILTSCSGDRTLRVWDISCKPPKTQSVVPASKFYVNACAYNPSGDLLATASSDHTVKLWSTTSWTVVGTFATHEDSVRWCAFSPDGNLLATASDDTTVCVLEVGSVKHISTLTRNSERVNCCVFAPNGWLLITGSSSGDLMLFNVYNTQLLKSQRGSHDMGVTALALDPESFSLEQQGSSIGGEFAQFKFASAGNDSSIKLWNVWCNGDPSKSKSINFSLEAELHGHTAAVYSCSYHPTERLLASGSADRSVILWDLTKNKIQKIEPHLRYVTHVSFSLDGRHLVSASSDRIINLWSVSDSIEEDHTDGAQESSELNEEPSLLSTTNWSMDDVVQWLETVAKQQSIGKHLHPDDLRAAERISSSVQQLSTSSDSHFKGGDELKCPITCELMRDPVIAADGYTYERTAITNWFSKGRRTCSSPVTNLPLTNTLLLPNRAIKTLIERQRSENNTT